MILPRSTDQLLLPVNPVFVWVSLLLALGVNMLPLGRHPAMPDVLALVLVFWNVHQPRRVGIFTAFAFGLLMDVHQGALLGQHALAYTLLSYLAITIHRRVLWFAWRGQMLHVALLFYAAWLVSLVVRLAAGAGWPEGWALLAPVLQAALWPSVRGLLLAPQRRPPDTDKNRPL